MSFICSYKRCQFLAFLTAAIFVFSLDSTIIARAGSFDASNAMVLPSQDGSQNSNASSGLAEYPPGTARDSVAATGMLVIQPLQGITANIRAAPDIDSPIVGGLNMWGTAHVIEPYGEAIQKVEQGEWVQVRTSGGVEGYTASYLYTIEEDIPPAGPLQDQGTGQDLDSMESILLITPVNDGIRIRETPESSEESQVVGFVGQGNIALVIEPADVGRSKLGEPNTWLRVLTRDGTEGYTAAWLFLEYQGNVPDWVYEASPSPILVDSPPSNAIVPSQVGAEFGEPETPASIAALNLSSDAADDSPQILPPLGASVIGLNLGESEPADDDISPTTAQELPATSDRETSANPIAAIPNGITSEEVPITIDVADDIEFESAQLFINDTALATFDAQPIEYMLNTSMLSEGPYELGFALITPEGVTSSSNLSFDVVDVPGELREVESDVDLGEEELQEEALAAQPVSRVLLVQGERIAFDLIFDLQAGLHPLEMDVEVETIPTEGDLGDILARIPNDIIPSPIYEQLKAQHPEFATIIILLMVTLLVPQGVFTLYWMLYTWNNPERAEQYRSPKEYYDPQYSFTAILPARQEAAVIADTIRSIDSIDYPEHLKEILVMIRDEDDDETIAAANEVIWELGKENIQLITFTDGPKNKPNGLNKALVAASKDVVCIFDAEDDPHPDIYNIVNTVMVRDSADVVQSGVQLMNFDSSWFSAFNVLEYFFWFKSGLHCFTRAMGVTPLGGNTVFFKRDWLELIDGWDASCLTEDADVGFRLTKLGAKIQIVYDAQHATQEETPDTVESFIKQRTRWVQGFYQIFFGWQWLGLPSLKQKITAVYILLNSLLQAGIVLYLPLGIYIAATQRVPVTIAILSYLPILLLFLQLLTNLVGIREFAHEYKKKLPLFFTLKMSLYYYPYQLLLSIAALRAIFRFLKREQAWEKTAHSNLHRQTISQPGA